ncbi:protein takeout [Halyomorpha halys]|uniref:protein takeout n=1 Tax=Halyomorpha halys TaxID=286706 RepID=UPI0006D526B6|nr:protein takeout [Halyomorpha halys]
MGVNPIEPFRFITMSVNQGTGPVTIKLDLKNFDMKGLSNMEIKEVTNDWKTMIIKAHLKQLDCEGDYSIEGKVLVLPISGTGKCSIVVKGVDIVATLKFSEVEKGGKNYFHVDSFETDITPTRSIFNFQNLFNGDKALGDNMNLFLNENHEEIVRELKPAISKGMSAGFIHLSNQVLSRINAKDIK